MQVIITTFDPHTEEEISTRTIDYTDALHRQWLGKRCMWALHQGYAVEHMREQDVQADD